MVDKFDLSEFRITKEELNKLFNEQNNELKSKAMENVKCSGFKRSKLKEHHKQFIENLMN